MMFVTFPIVSFSDEENEKSVPVILNGSESELVFSEHQFTGDTVSTKLPVFLIK